VDAKGEVTLLANRPKRRWIDNVALHPDGAVGVVAGKTAFVRNGKAEDKSFELPSTVGGLAFAPKGLRLAVAHYNGVTLWFPNMWRRPKFWNGRARILPSPSALTTSFWSPRCTNRHCMAGGWPITATCACPAIPGGSGRCPGARAAKRWRRRAPMP